MQKPLVSTYHTDILKGYQSNLLEDEAGEGRVQQRHNKHLISAVRKKYVLPSKCILFRLAFLGAGFIYVPLEELCYIFNGANGIVGSVFSLTRSMTSRLTKLLTDNRINCTGVIHAFSYCLLKGYRLLCCLVFTPAE